MSRLEIQAGPHERVHCPVAVPDAGAGAGAAAGGLSDAEVDAGSDAVPVGVAESAREGAATGQVHAARAGGPAGGGSGAYAGAAATQMGGAVLRIADGAHSVPMQESDGRLWCVLPYLAAGGAESAEIAVGTAPELAAGARVRDAGGAAQAAEASRAGPDTETANGVRIADQGEHLEVSVDGVRWCDYHYAAHPVRSYLHPVIGPYGVPMTRAWPVQDGVPGEEHDHVHHRSLWVAHGLVNGVDFWSEADGHGYQVHGGFEAVESGPVFGRIVQRVSWRKHAPDGTPVLEEQRTLTFWNTPSTARLLDLTVTLHAVHGDVTFGDTKEGGLCALRVPEAIKGARGGVISNAYGALHEAENWGQRAPWVDYSGELSYSGELTAPDGARRTVGVAIFDHPRNPHYPTHWHVRGYGLFAANPFGLADYGSGYRQNGDWALAAGEQATFRYRVLWHAGDAQTARVGARFLDWAAPPTIIAAN